MRLAQVSFYNYVSKDEARQQLPMHMYYCILSGLWKMNCKRLTKYWKVLRERVQQVMNHGVEPRQCKSKEITRYI